MQKIGKAQRRQIEELAQRLFSVPECRTAPACAALREELFIALYRWVTNHEQREPEPELEDEGVDWLGEEEKEQSLSPRGGISAKRGEWEQLEFEVFLTFMENELWTYDPKKGQGFCAFFGARMYYRPIDLWRSKVRKGHIGAPVLSLDVSAAEDGGTFLELLADPKCEERARESYLSGVEAAVKLATLVLAPLGKANSEEERQKKIGYFRMFFTGQMTQLLQEAQDEGLLRIFCRRERDLFRAIHLGFLDFLMVDRCRSVAAIACSRYKTMDLLVPGHKRAPVHVPLEQVIYIVYTGKSKSTISKQLSSYKEQSLLCLQR